MGYEILSDIWQGRRRAVLLQGKEIIDWAIERGDDKSYAGQVVTGKITRSNPLQMTLPSGEIVWLKKERGLQNGQEVMCTITCEAHGDKSAIGSCKDMLAPRSDPITRLLRDYDLHRDDITIEQDTFGLFDHRDLDEAFDALLRPHVDLVGGGSVMIEQTQAMCVVDVDGGANDNELSVNLAAADMIAKQLRWREIAGIIIVDFISMQEAGDWPRLIQRLEENFAIDPLDVRVHGKTRLGLVEITRTRRYPTLQEVL